MQAGSLHGLLPRALQARTWERGESIKLELEPHNRNVPEDELLADLKRVAGELQKSSVTVDEYNERGRFHATTLIRRLKRPWLKVLELAGLSKTRNLHISKEELFDNLVDVWRKLGRQPKYSDLTSQT